MIELYLIGTVFWIVFSVFNDEGGYISGFGHGLLSAAIWPYILVLMLMDNFKAKLRKEIRQEIQNVSTNENQVEGKPENNFPKDSNIVARYDPKTNTFWEKG